MSASIEKDYLSPIGIKELIENARAAYKLNPTVSRIGPKHLSPMKVAVEGMSADELHGVSPDDAALLLKYFEEIYRGQNKLLSHRHWKFLDPADRPKVVSYLAPELASNATIFDYPPSKLVAFTVYHGAIAQELVDAFPDFTPKFIAKVAGSVLNPHEAVQRVHTNYVALAEEAREPNSPFSRFPRHLLLRAAQYADSGRTATQFRKTIDDFIEESRTPESELALLVDAPEIFESAVFNFTSAPRRYLLQFTKSMRDMMDRLCVAGSAFEPYSDMPEFFARVLIGKGKKRLPEAAYMRVRECVTQLTDASETPGSKLALFADDEWAFRYAAVRYHVFSKTSEAVPFLERAFDLYQALAEKVEDPESDFACYARYPEQLKRIAITLTADPKRPLPEPGVLVKPYRPLRVEGASGSAYQLRNDV